MPGKEDVGSLLDALYLELLHLIEQLTTCRVSIEKLNTGGQLLLAKTRYVQGSHTVSVAQIPTENSNDFKALCSVKEKTNHSKIGKTELVLHREPVNKEQGYVEPLYWFGVLAPSSLRAAAEKFRMCTELVVESANIQRELGAVMERIDLLKKIKAD